MKRLRWIALLVTVLGVTSPAGAGDDGGTQSPFVLGVGARELGMGRTGTGLAADGTALFWNPARLAAVLQPEGSFFRTKLYTDGIHYHAAFLTYPTLDLGTFAAGYQRLGAGDIERRDERNQLLGSFDDGESALLVGWGRGWEAGFSFGGSLKLVQQSVGDASDVGVGLDLGMGYERSLGEEGAHRLAAGTALRNALAPSLRLDSDTVSEPRVLSLGAAYASVQPRARFTWAAAADVDLPSRAGSRFGAGAEVTYASILSLRAGVDDGHPTAGFGVAWRQISFDYALRTDDALSRNDRFSLTVRAGRPTDVRREERRVAREAAVSERLASLLAEREGQERARTLAAADSAFAQQRWEVALRLYRRVLALDPDPEIEQRAAATELRIALGEARARLAEDEPALAAAAYQEILARWPQDREATAGLEAARSRLQASADRTRQTNELLREAMTRLTGEDLLGAEAALEELLRLEPQHALGNELRARVRTARRGKGDAELQRARALAASGEHGDALRRLSVARRLLGDSPELVALASDWNAALESARRGRPVEDAAPRTPVPPRASTPASRRALTTAERRQLDRQYREGLDAFQLGDFDRAIRAWRGVWARDPDFQQVSDYLIKACLYEGIASYSNGRYDLAIDLCRKVLEIDPNNEKAKRYLERIREEKTELEQIEGGKGR
jgi:tetratricopeptide (TPR) repeat protein